MIEVEALEAGMNVYPGPNFLVGTFTEGKPYKLRLTEDGFKFYYVVSDYGQIVCLKYIPDPSETADQRQPCNEYIQYFTREYEKWTWNGPRKAKAAKD